MSRIAAYAPPKRAVSGENPVNTTWRWAGTGIALYVRHGILDLHRSVPRATLTDACTTPASSGRTSGRRPATEHVRVDVQGEEAVQDPGFPDPDPLPVRVRAQPACTSHSPAPEATRPVLSGHALGIPTPLPGPGCHIVRGTGPSRHAWHHEPRPARLTPRYPVPPLAGTAREVTRLVHGRGHHLKGRDGTWRSQEPSTRSSTSRKTAS